MSHTLIYQFYSYFLKGKDYRQVLRLDPTSENTAVDNVSSLEHRPILGRVNEMDRIINYSGTADGTVLNPIGLPYLCKNDIHITEVCKIHNDVLRPKWYSVQSEMFHPDRTQLLFHGTSIGSIVAIIQDGFKLPSKPGLFGSGIYFASDESKSAQFGLHRGSYMLLSCSVRIGKSLRLESGCMKMNLSELQSMGCDSVYVPGGTKRTGGVRRSEFVIYRPEQALPTHVLCFRLKGC